ncbi:hypothetical protein HDV05_000306 [Chytridiales sp. JEL 0842]|nr:hypothetical protein HDV05_000306 [Chytridiales sp. JEL 0842]
MYAQTKRPTALHKILNDTAQSTPSSISQKFTITDCPQSPYKVRIMDSAVDLLSTDPSVPISDYITKQQHITSKSSRSHSSHEFDDFEIVTSSTPGGMVSESETDTEDELSTSDLPSGYNFDSFILPSEEEFMSNPLWGMPVDSLNVDENFQPRVAYVDEIEQLISKLDEQESLQQVLASTSGIEGSASIPAVSVLETSQDKLKWIVDFRRSQDYNRDDDDDEHWAVLNAIAASTLSAASRTREKMIEALTRSFTESSASVVTCADRSDIAANMNLDACKRRFVADRRGINSGDLEDYLAELEMTVSDIQHIEEDLTLAASASSVSTLEDADLRLERDGDQSDIPTEPVTPSSPYFSAPSSSLSAKFPFNLPLPDTLPPSRSLPPPPLSLAIDTNSQTQRTRGLSTPTTPSHLYTAQSHLSSAQTLDNNHGASDMFLDMDTPALQRNHTAGAKALKLMGVTPTEEANMLRRSLYRGLPSAGAVSGLSSATTDRMSLSILSPVGGMVGDQFPAEDPEYSAQMDADDEDFEDLFGTGQISAQRQLRRRKSVAKAFKVMGILPEEMPPPPSLHPTTPTAAVATPVSPGGPMQEPKNLKALKVMGIQAAELNQPFMESPVTPTINKRSSLQALKTLVKSNSNEDLEQSFTSSSSSKKSKRSSLGLSISGSFRSSLILNTPTVEPIAPPVVFEKDLPPKTPTFAKEANDNDSDSDDSLFGLKPHTKKSNGNKALRLMGLSEEGPSTSSPSNTSPSKPGPTRTQTQSHQPLFSPDQETLGSLASSFHDRPLCASYLQLRVGGANNSMFTKNGHKRRYVVLLPTSKKLMFFKSSETSEKPIGSLSLNDATTAIFKGPQRKAFSEFGVQCDGVEWSLMAEDDDEREKWMVALESVVSGAKAGESTLSRGRPLSQQLTPAMMFMLQQQQQQQQKTEEVPALPNASEKDAADPLGYYMA